MLNPNSTRVLYAGERHEYNLAVSRNNILTRASVLMDSHIFAAQKTARRLPSDTIPDFTDEITALTAYAHGVIAKADLTDEGHWNDYYRLISQAAFLEQRLKASFAFEKPSHWKERKQLVQGTYSIGAQLLSEVLNEYDLAGEHQTDERELRGVIQELTMPTLFNKNEHRNRVAIPSTTYNDMHKKIDVEIWSLPDRHTTPRYIPAQVKSSPHYHSEKETTPKGGITVYAYDFDNQRDLAVSRLIVKDYKHAINEGEPLSPAEIQQLDDAHERLFSTIKAKTNHSF